MKAKSSGGIFILAIIVVLLFLLLYPSSVQADGEIPLSTDVPLEITPTNLPIVDPISSTPVPPNENTPDGIETASDAPTPVPVELTTATPEPSLPTAESVEVVDVAEQPSLLESLQTLPDETSVVVLDENGQPIPLVTQESAEAILTMDPVWCPAGQPPTPGANGCTASYATMGLLLANAGSYINSQSVGGTVWVTTGSVGDVNPVTIDGAVYSNWRYYSLNLQGGWNGVSGSSAISGSSVFSVPITVTNWNNSILISDLSANVNISNVNAPAGTVEVVGPNIQGVTIDNVTAKRLNIISNSSGNTIRISDSTFSGGVQSYIDGWLNSVVIEDSHFDNASANGLLEYNGWGGITITNSTFNNNGAAGANINPFGGTTVRITNGSFTGDDVGLRVAYCGNLIMNGPVIGNNKTVNTQISCPSSGTYLSPNETSTSAESPTQIPASTAQLLVVSVALNQTSVERSLDCDQSKGFQLVWSSGDRFEMSCLTGGNLEILQVDNTSITSQLPAGFEYVSAYQVVVTQHGNMLSVLPEEGYIQVSFVTPEPDVNYNIMFWDEQNNKWVLLHEYLKDPDGKPKMFPLDPSDPKDAHKIWAGTHFTSSHGEVTTNFTGTYVLVKQ